MTTLFPKPLDTSVSQTQDGLAIVANGNNHAAISSGQFVYVKNHDTLAEGLYKATSAIAQDGALSTSNLTPDGSGGLNDLQSQVTSLNSNIAPVSVALTQNDHIHYVKSGSVVTISFWWASQAEMAAMTMPTGLRPQRQMYFPATILIGSTYSTGTLAINTNGAISAIAPTSFDNCFSEITYVAFN